MIGGGGAPGSRVLGGGRLVMNSGCLGIHSQVGCRAGGAGGAGGKSGGKSVSGKGSGRLWS
jgi:hypothetical protein